MPDRTLALVRHGQSEWNEKNLFTGWRDVELTDLGREEARRAGKILAQAGTRFDVAFTSALKRAQHTLAIILAELGQEDIEIVADQALNERDYGDLSGLNKDDARARWGEEQVHVWRRSFDVPPPGGESLKMTAERVLPYYNSTIVPRLAAGGNVLVAAHGNSLRALIMSLEGLSGEAIVARELATGVPIVYALDAEGRPLRRTDWEGGTAREATFAG
jgi:2,3-bisphosphoglycerate-dependent phosphoglycerate mutase